MTDPITLIRALRPDDAQLEGTWQTAARAAVLDDILASRSRRPVRPYLFAGAGLAAASAAALTLALVRPGASQPGRDAPALPAPHLAAVVTALHHLAGTAAARPSELGDGRYWHMIVREHQTGPEGQADSSTTLESWTDPTGRVWRHDVERFGSQAPVDDYYEFAPGDDQVDYPSPAYLDSLPTDVSALYDYLDDHVSGSASHEEAIFVAVGDMLRGGFAPPQLRSAAIQVLGRLPHVVLSDTTTDPLGRTIEQFDFVDDSVRAGQVESVSFDPRTAQILDEGESAHGAAPIVEDGPSGRRVLSSDLDFTSSVVVADTVDMVPAGVLDKAALQH